MKRVEKVHAKHRQTGAVLVIGLVMLAVLALIGAVTFSVASLEERMSGNTRDQMRAFEAAEASLRDCEAVIGGFGTLPAFDGTGGMYTAAAVTAMPIWQTTDWKDATKVRTMSTSLTDLATAPRCIVEVVAIVDELPVDGAVSGPQARVQQTIYRVTARGFGRSVNTVELLQSTFRRQ
jgi:type IV pilus assembly protein PilX